MGCLSDSNLPSHAVVYTSYAKPYNVAYILYTANYITIVLHISMHTQIFIFIATTNVTVTQVQP